METIARMLPQLLGSIGLLAALTIALGFSATHAWLQFKYGIEDPIEPPLLRTQYLRTGVWLLTFVALTVLVSSLLLTHISNLANMWADTSIPVFVCTIGVATLFERTAWHFGARTARHTWGLASLIGLCLPMAAVIVFMSRPWTVYRWILPRSVQFVVVALSILGGLFTFRRAFPTADWPRPFTGLRTLVRALDNQARNLSFYVIVVALCLSIMPLNLAFFRPDFQPDFTLQPNVLQVVLWDIASVICFYWVSILFYGPVCMVNLNLSRISIVFRNDAPAPYSVLSEGELLLLVERAEEFVVLPTPAATPAEMEVEVPAKLYYIPKDIIGAVELRASWRTVNGEASERAEVAEGGGAEAAG